MSAVDWILYTDRVVGKDDPSYTDVLNRPLNEVLQASGFTNYETSFTGFAKRPIVDATASQFMQSTGGTQTQWHTLVTGDVTDLTTAATGITKVGTISTGTWQGTSIATTYTDAKVKTVTGTALRLDIGGTATDPTFNISTSYAGQATIVTLGTIATGVWQGTAVATAYTIAQVIDLTGTSNRTTVGGTATHPTVDISTAYVGQTTITTLGVVATGTWQATAIANAYLASGIDVTKLTVGTTLPSNVVTSSLTSVGTIATGVWQGSSIATTYTDAKIKTVTGTSNRLTIGGTSTDPTFDISTSYVGQATITTLGTVSSGTWSATAIGTTVGGTGLTSYTLGDTVYASAANTLSKLAGNTTAVQQFKTQTGTGAASAAPVWHTLVTADVTDLTTATTGITKVGTVTTGTWQATVLAGTYGGTGVNNGSSTITLAGNFTTSGAFATTLTVTNTTNVTLPTSGTLVNSAVATLSSLTSIGTIATGVWQATVIAPAYGGTGVANNAASTITISGAFGLTLTLTAGTSVTLPTIGTLVNSAVATLSSLTSVGVLASTHLTSPVVDSGGLTITAGGLTVTAGGITVNGGTVTTIASGTAAAGLNLPHGVAPTSPVNGDVWTSTSGTFWRINGATKQAAFIDVATLSSLTSIGTIATGVWQGTAVASGFGGTGFTTYTQGDVIYASATNTLARLAVGTTNYVLTSSGTVPQWSSSITVNTSGNAATATALATARAINGTNFDGTAAITVTAAAGTLTGTTLNATVVTSSLTSVGTLGSLTVSGTGTVVTVTTGGTANILVSRISNATTFQCISLNNVVTTTGIAGLRYSDTSDSFYYNVPSGSNHVFQVNGAGIGLFGLALLRVPDVPTTASAANMFMASGASFNDVSRSTSSLRYKDDVRALGSEEARNIIQGATPISFRSKAKADGGKYFVGFGAEDIAEIDERLIKRNAKGQPDEVEYGHMTAPIVAVLKDLIAFRDRAVALYPDLAVN